MSEMWPDAAADDEWTERVERDSPAVLFSGLSSELSSGQLSSGDAAVDHELPDFLAQPGEEADGMGGAELAGGPVDGQPEAYTDDSAHADDAADVDTAADAGSDTAADAGSDTAADAGSDTAAEADDSVGGGPDHSAEVGAEVGFEATGDAAVDGVLTGLVDLDDVAPADQVARYDAIHRELHGILIGAGEDVPAASDDSGA